MGPNEHVVSYEIGAHDQLWWRCTCGDEGGPFESFEVALLADIQHERTAPRRIP